MKETNANKLIKEAGIGQNTREELAVKALNKFQKHLKQAPESISKPLTLKMSQVSENKRLIECQRTKFNQNIQTSQRCTEILQSLCSTADNRLKELGDVQNWAEIIEKQVQMIEKTVQIRKNHVKQQN